MNGSLERQKQNCFSRVEEAGGCGYRIHLWYFLADHAVIYSKEDVRFIFKNGMEIQV